MAVTGSHLRFQHRDRGNEPCVASKGPAASDQNLKHVFEKNLGPLHLATAFTLYDLYD